MEHSHELKKSLGLWFGVFVSICGSVGMGVLRFPSEVAQHLPSTEMFLAAWGFGAVFMFLSAPPVMELGTMIPRSAGFFLFARRAFGPFTGFVVAWADWMVLTSATALISITMAEELGALIPSLTGKERILAVLIVSLLLALNWPGVRCGDLLQKIATFPKVAALLFIAGTFLSFGSGAGFVASTESIQLGPSALATGMILSLLGIIPCYGGWEAPIYYGGEFGQIRHLIKAIFWGMLGCLVVYAIMMLSLLWMLDISEIASVKVAYALGAEKIFGASGATLMHLLALTVMFNTAVHCIMAAPRVMYNMAREGYIHRSLSVVNAGGTPAIGMAVTAAVAIVLVSTGTFRQVLNTLGLFQVLNYTLAFAAVFALRKREPDTPRPYLAWGHPWSTGLVLALSLVFLVGVFVTDTKNSLLTLAIGLAAYPVYRLVSRESKGS